MGVDADAGRDVDFLRLSAPQLLIKRKTTQVEKSEDSFG